MAKGDLHTDHPLLTLQGRRAGAYTLYVAAWPGRFVGQAEFVLYLKGSGGETSKRPVVEGLYGRMKIPGSQAEAERGILDVILTSAVEVGATRVELQGSELEEEIMGAVCDTIRDTWSSIMYVAYGWKTLKQIQELRHPLQVTDEGHVLFTHGFRGGWKDYYYSEGWWEGPIKLKAERPPTAEYRLLWDAENARVLLEFLKRPLAEGHLQFQEEGSSDIATLSILSLEQTARSRALRILQTVDLLDGNLLAEKDRVLAIYPSPESIVEISAAELGEVVLRAGGAD